MTPFPAPEDWDDWLRLHHASETEIWVRMFKKASGIPSIGWEQAVIGALCWGWIDGIRRSHDDLSFIQRYTPRRKGGTWSQKNCLHAERLIAEGRMQPPGLAQVLAAKADGRWDAAYAGSAAMEIPADFLEALAAGPQSARDTYAALNRQNLYAIYHRLLTAKRPETRTRRIADFVALLARGERFH